MDLAFLAERAQDPVVVFDTAAQAVASQLRLQEEYQTMSRPVLLSILESNLEDFNALAKALLRGVPQP